MLRRPPTSKLTDPSFPSTTHFRSKADQSARAYDDPALHADARRADGLYARHFRHRARRHRADAARTIDARDPARRRCRHLFADPDGGRPPRKLRSEEHTSELQSLMRISYAVFFLKKNKYHT